MDRGVEDPRAVEMRGEAAAPGERERLVQVVAGDRPAADGVLQREQTRAREMRIVGVDRRLDLRKLERAVGAVRQRPRVDGSEHGDAARFVTIAVLFGADDHFVAALAVAHQRREVRLRARGE